MTGRKVVIRGLLEMYLGARNPRDEVKIDGKPSMRVVVRGGTAGDLATPASLVNAVQRVMEAEAGVRTALELFLPRYGG